MAAYNGVYNGVWRRYWGHVHEEGSVDLSKIPKYSAHNYIRRAILYFINSNILLLNPWRKTVRMHGQSKSLPW